MQGIFFRFALSEVNNLPFVKCLRHVALKLLINFKRIDSALRRSGSKLRWFEFSLNLIADVFFADMQIGIIFLIVKQDMVVIYHTFTLLSVSISWMDIICHPLG